MDLVDLDEIGPHLGYRALSTGTLLVGDPSDAVDLEASMLLQWLDFKAIKRSWDAALTARIRDGSYGRP